MLDLMRKHAGTWLVKFILGAIIIVFTFWGVGSYRAQRGNRVAMVNGKPVTLDEYRAEYDRLMNQFRQRFGDSFNDDLVKALQLDKQALEQVIEQKLVQEEAERLELRVSDSELARAVRSLPFFQTAGAFDTRRYRSLLAANHLTPEEFEAGQRQTMLQNKLKSFVLGGVTVSDLEAREWYDWSRASVRIDYVRFDPGSFTEGFSPEEKSLKAYFDAHRSAYETDPQVRVRYVRFDPAQFRSQVNLSEDDIAEYYEAHRDEFKTEETIEARHILIRVEEDAPEADVAAARKRAEEVYRKAKAGEDFATLAKTYSEGPTRDAGGRLGAFSRGRMVKPFEDKAFSMNPGDIGEPVRTRFGWHIIKVEKKTPASVMSLEAASAKIHKELIQERAKNAAYDAADEFYGETFAGDDLGKLAQERNRKAMETGFFTKAEGPAQVADKKKFADAAFSLQVNEISDIQELSDGFYLMQVVEKLPAAIPPFAEVAEKVRKDWLKQQQDEKAKKEAEKLLAESSATGATLAKQAAKMGRKLETTDFFKRNAAIPGIGYEPALNAAAFRLTAARPLAKETVKGKPGYFVIALKEHKKPADDGFEKDREQVLSQILPRKKSQVYSEFIADLKSRAEIERTPGFLDE